MVLWLDDSEDERISFSTNVFLNLSLPATASVIIETEVDGSIQLDARTVETHWDSVAPQTDSSDSRLAHDYSKAFLATLLFIEDLYRKPPKHAHVISSRPFCHS